MSSQKIIERNRRNAQVRFQDLSDKIFSRLTVIERVFTKPKATMWNCKCECGNEKIVDGRHLKGKKILSCGCLNLEINSKRMKGNILGKVHGFTKHPLRAIWKAIIQRCENPKNKFYENYGKRGISICEEWRKDMTKFIEWGYINGWKKGLSIDRKDNDGNYEPKNCHWITLSENSRKGAINRWSKEKNDNN